MAMYYTIDKSYDIDLTIPYSMGSDQEYEMSTLSKAKIDNANIKVESTKIDNVITHLNDEEDNNIDFYEMDNHEYDHEANNNPFFDDYDDEMPTTYSENNMEKLDISVSNSNENRMSNSLLSVDNSHKVVQKSNNACTHNNDHDIEHSDESIYTENYETKNEAVMDKTTLDQGLDIARNSIREFNQSKDKIYNDLPDLNHISGESILNSLLKGSLDTIALLDSYISKNNIKVEDYTPEHRSTDNYYILNNQVFI